MVNCLSSNRGNFGLTLLYFQFYKDTLEPIDCSFMIFFSPNGIQYGFMIVAFLCPLRFGDWRLYRLSTPRDIQLYLFLGG